MQDDLKQRHVAIVGCGFTGTTAFYQLVHKYPVAKITLLEKSGLFGPGFPYQPAETDAYLINNTNDTMCLDPSNRHAFLEWLQAHDRYAEGLDEKGHLPRRVYGEFLCDVVAATRTEAARHGIEVEMIVGECTDIVEDESATIYFDGGSIAADMAILSTGRCPDVDPFGFADDAQYFDTHMPGTKLSDLPLDANVHILGASLSAYDVINQLFAPDTGCEFVADGNNRLRFVANGNERSAVLCSRSGILKKMQSRYPGEISRYHFNAAAIGQMAERSVSLRDLLLLIEKDALANGVKLNAANILTPYANCCSAGDFRQHVIDLLRTDIDAAASDEVGANFLVDYFDDAQFDIWDLFAKRAPTFEAEREFRARYETALLSYAAPCPIPTAQKMLALAKAGRLDFVKGIRNVHQTKSGFAYEHDFGHGEACFMVNATGSVDRDIDSTRQTPLIRNLAARDLLRPYRIDKEDAPGIDVDLHTFRCAGSRHIYAANMFLWGPGIYVSSAITMATVVARLLSAHPVLQCDGPRHSRKQSAKKFP